jgi:hypothetical protein
LSWSAANEVLLQAINFSTWIGELCAENTCPDCLYRSFSFCPCSFFLLSVFALSYLFSSCSLCIDSTPQPRILKKHPSVWWRNTATTASFDRRFLLGSIFWLLFE